LTSRVRPRADKSEIIRKIVSMNKADREKLNCAGCGGIGDAELSTPDGRSWAVRVDRVPKGFKVIQCEYGSNFYCARCEIEVEPQRPQLVQFAASKWN
jgi:hypothetical protein